MTWGMIAKAMMQESEAFISRKCPPLSLDEFRTTEFIAYMSEKHGRSESKLYGGTQRKIEKGTWPSTWSQELVDDMNPYYEYRLKKIRNRQSTR